MNSDSTPTPLTKTQQRKLRVELRQKIFTEADLSGPLKSVAYAIIDYVYAFSSPYDDPTNAPYFEKKTEWVLEPDQWIALSFRYTRKYSIDVIVGVTALVARKDVPLKNAHYPRWIRFTVTSAKQLPTVMAYLEQAYYDADSGYRRRHGKPKKGEPDKA